MPADRWQRIQATFDAALARPPAARAAFIEAECDDADVRAEVASLLHAADTAADFLSEPALDAFARQVSREGWTVRVGERVGAYTITERIGAGGMGEVWRARDERLGRDVAIKLLLPHAADATPRPTALEREARAAGSLNHPNVATVYDVGLHLGAPYIVMEHLEGLTLRARLASGPLPLDDALQIGLQILRGLQAAHARSIVHRDLKPENVFLTEDGGVKVLDFGIAALAADQGVAGGTPGYAAPEQLRGEAMDGRTDIFAFGVVLRETLGTTTRAVEELVTRCIEPSRERRFASAGDVVAALESIVQSRQPVRARVLAFVLRPVVSAGVVALVAVGAVGAWRWQQAAAKLRWAHVVAAPEIKRLALDGDYAAAFLLAHDARRAAPGDPQLTQLWADVSLPITLTSDPDGADVQISTYRTPPERWLSLGRTPLKSVNIPRGLARIRVTKSGYEPFEGSVYPQSAVRVPLDAIGAAPSGMVRVSRGRDPVRFGALPPVDDFWIDRFEVTNRAFKAFVDAGGYRNRSHWREPFVDEGRELSWAAAMSRFRDQSGQPGPATWRNGSYPDGHADLPVGGVSWYEAAAYARFVNKNLPTMYHWYRAAGLGRFFDILPLSNFDGKGPAHVGAYRGLGAFGAYDMAGNVKEWCWNASGTRRFVLGGAWNEPRYTFADYDARAPFDRAANLGFRLARYEQPPPAAALAPVTPSRITSLPSGPLVRDDIFEVYRRQYAYDPAPLNVTLEATDVTPLWTRLRVTFDAAYGDERMLAHLFLPREAKPPYQTVVFFGGSDAYRLRSSRDMNMGPVELIVASGRALLYPVYKGTYERQGSVVDSVQEQRERLIAVYRDLATSIDYLETRQDIDHGRLAFYGISSGADTGVYLTAIESRFTASILQGSGLAEAPAPELDSRNYAMRVRVPTLLLCGRYDFELPYETSQRPLFALLGPPAAHKRFVSVESGHTMPINEVRGAILPWLDRYLGPVTR